MRQDKQIVKLCYDLSVALFVHACERFKLSTLVTFASLRFKVDELHKFIGLEPLRLEGQLLEPFLCKPFFDEKSVGSVLHVENFSLAARDLASRYKFFWDDRIEILEQLSENEKKAA